MTSCNQLHTSLAPGSPIAPLVLGHTCLDACPHTASARCLLLGWHCQGSMFGHQKFLHTSRAIPDHAYRCTAQWQRPAQEKPQSLGTGVITCASMMHILHTPEIPPTESCT